MSVQVMQAAGSVFLAAVGGSLVGQYRRKRKALRALEFGTWRDNRILLMFVLTALVFFAPDVAQHSHEWLRGLFD